MGKLRISVKRECTIFSECVSHLAVFRSVQSGFGPNRQRACGG